MFDDKEYQLRKYVLSEFISSARADRDLTVKIYRCLSCGIERYSTEGPPGKYHECSESNWDTPKEERIGYSYMDRKCGEWAYVGSYEPNGVRMEFRSLLKDFLSNVIIDVGNGQVTLKG